MDEGELDYVKEFNRRVGIPLAGLRAEQLLDVIKCRMSVDSGGVAIGISPRDSILEKYTRGEITNMIYKIFKRIRARGSDGGLVAIAPLTLHLVGEYSPRHRWHYHGTITVENIVILDKIKKRINTTIGRVVTEQITNENNYINYMFKQYTNTDILSTYFPWNRDECYIHVHR